ncbi:hypothetical protein HDU76_007208 [Blyttiomyces sp. JEL0837]|nr:hypothetical protein HDU76_007208 [Blyttiomyces sp. JEL0837]
MYLFHIVESDLEVVHLKALEHATLHLMAALKTKNVVDPRSVETSHYVGKPGIVAEVALGNGKLITIARGGAFFKNFDLGTPGR